MAVSFRAFAEAEGRPLKGPLSGHRCSCTMGGDALGSSPSFLQHCCNSKLQMVQAINSFCCKLKTDSWDATLSIPPMHQQGPSAVGRLPRMASLPVTGNGCRRCRSSGTKYLSSIAAVLAAVAEALQLHSILPCTSPPTGVVTCQADVRKDHAAHSCRPGQQVWTWRGKVDELGAKLEAARKKVPSAAAGRLAPRHGICATQQVGKREAVCPSAQQRAHIRHSLGC